MQKKLLIIIVVLALGALGLYQGFIKEKQETTVLKEVFLGTISQEILETGQVKKGEEISLGFQSAGKLEKIYVRIGDEVKEGRKFIS